MSAAPGAAPVRAITFDFWNTLLYEAPGQLRGLRIDAWLRILADAGRPVERVVLEALLDESWRTFNEAWQENRQYRAADAAAFVIDGLGLADLPQPVRDEMVDAFTTVGERADLGVTPNVDVALKALHEAGVRIGIICDVGMTPSTILRAHLDRNGLLDLFDHWSFSDEVGVYKPDARIFEHALAGLGGVAPAAAAHIGDLRRTDVAGAKALGITAIRYTGVFDDPGGDDLPEADHVVVDHADLPTTLGL